MQKTTLEICCGTACWLLGAEKLLEFAEKLPPEFEGKVSVEPRTCLGLCEMENLGGAPFVRINGREIIAKATPEALLARIRLAVKETEE